MNDAAQALAQRLIRNFNTAEMDQFVRPPLYETHGTQLALGTAAQRLGASIDTLPPGKRGCPYHFHHAEEEMFIVLEGSGTLRVAGEMLPLVAGDVVFIPPGPEYPHHIINTSEAPLKYLSISTQEPIEVCEYPDSGKYNVSVDEPADPTKRRFRAIQRSGSTLDYWDGEA